MMSDAKILVPNTGSENQHLQEKERHGKALSEGRRPHHTCSLKDNKNNSEFLP